MGRLSQEAELVGDKYVFADGYEIPKKTIDLEMGLSSLTPLEKSILEKSAGKSLDLLTAEEKHRKYLAKKKEMEEKERAFREQREAEYWSDVNFMKGLNENGFMHIFKDGKLSSAIPFTDDELRYLYKEMMSYINLLRGYRGYDVRPCLQIEDKKYPGVVIFIERKGMGDWI